MKISQAKKIYSFQMDALWSRKQELTKMLKEDSHSGGDSPSYDRVELSEELTRVEQQYDQTQAVMERIQETETGIHNAEVAKQQGKAIAKAADDMLKCLEIARRISEGAKVPAEDEKMLMDYSHELYMAAKNMAMMNMQNERKEYDSVQEDEEEGQEDTRTPSEIAGDAEIAVDLPQPVQAEAAEPQ